ncbi:MAG TPA: protein translocase subunit SecD [Acidimicrobiales bacterium]|nr:protein translocase subunit SecD [Acidimicrobiales bacterium]
MRRGLIVSLAGIVLVALAMLAGTVAAGNSPELGLDLQGGASVVLRPKGDVDRGTLDQSIEIIRNRVDGLGVAEPDISRQGENIIVQLPGVKDQQRALDIVGQTAELRFRPVLGSVPVSETEAPPTPGTTTTTLDPAAAATSTTLDPAAAATTTTTVAPAPAEPVPTTPREEDVADREVVLPLIEDGEVVQRYRLGPAELTGSAIRTASADFDTAANRWLVEFSTTGEGRKPFGDLTTKLQGQLLAVVLDGVVKSVATVTQPITDGEGQISGDFSQREAKDLALVLRFGALPVELEPETVQTVSASLGNDSLRAGITAGIVGLALVLLYMVLYYRALGVVVLLGLSVWAALMWSIVSYLGASRGLALSLAGAVGIIISVGVTVDSYVVYFERLKDEVRSGKTIRASVDRGFSRAFRTILAADTASFIGAGLLYWLTVGSVRGFAFFLGLSTILDVVVAWFFTRPLVILLGRNRLFTEARWLGVARGLAAEPRGATT